MQWHSASIPHVAVIEGGHPTVSSGSTSAMRGSMNSDRSETFTWCSMDATCKFTRAICQTHPLGMEFVVGIAGVVTTAFLETSAPVPEVVGMAM